MRIPRVLSLSLFVYVCLDIANPLMPGALQFARGTIEVVEADRARRGGDTLVPVAPSLPLGLTAVAGPVPGAPRHRPIRARLRRRPPRSRRPIPSRSRPPSADDH